MIMPSHRVRILVATQPVDFRKGHDGLAALVQSALKEDPFTGTVFVFRAKRADRLKILFWDGTGLVMAYKRLEETTFIWPAIRDGVLTLNRAQFEALFDGRGGSENSPGDCFPDKRIDEIQLDAMIIGPPVERTPAQFRPVVDDQDIRISTLTGHALQHVHDPFARQREIHLDRRALAGAVVLEIGSAELAAVGQRIAGEIERPALVGGDRAPGPLAALTRDFLALGSPQPQPFLAVDPLDDLDVHPEALAGQLGMQHAIAIPPMLA